MSAVSIETTNGIAVVTLQRGKVNAIDPEMIRELDDGLDSLRNDDAAAALILTGSGKFFSFGFDVPLIYAFEREELTSFIRSFCALYRKLFLYPKPVLAAINGHAVAGGYIMALACDKRFIVDAPVKVALNEVQIGARLFAGVVAMLQHVVGGGMTEEVILGGRMYDAHEARERRLVDRLCPAGSLINQTQDCIRESAAMASPTYGQLKELIRCPVAETWDRLEQESIERFVDVWYSPASRVLLKQVAIR